MKLKIAVAILALTLGVGLQAHADTVNLAAHGTNAFARATPCGGFLRAWWRSASRLGWLAAKGFRSSADYSWRRGFLGGERRLETGRLTYDSVVETRSYMANRK